MSRIERRNFLAQSLAGGLAGSLGFAATACAQDAAKQGGSAQGGSAQGGSDEGAKEGNALGLCTSPKNAELVAKQGAAFIEVSCGRDLIPHKSDAEWEGSKKRLLAIPVRARAANSFLPGRLKSTGPKADHAGILTYAKRAFERAKSVGIDTITFGSSGSRSLPEGFPRADAEIQFASLLARLGTLAAPFGITVSVEPLQKRETNFINLVSEGARLTRLVDHPNVKITADIFRMMRGDEGPEALRGAGPWIHHVHVAEKRKRSAPGNDGDDFRPYLKALADIGYSGKISIESRWSKLAEELPVALRTLRTQLGRDG